MYYIYICILIGTNHVFVLTGWPTTTFYLHSRLPEDNHKKQFKRQPENVIWRTLTNLRNVIFSWPQLTPITLENKKEHLQASTTSQTAFTVIYFSHHTSSASKINLPCTWPKGFPPHLEIPVYGHKPTEILLDQKSLSSKIQLKLESHTFQNKEYTCHVPHIIYQLQGNLCACSYTQYQLPTKLEDRFREKKISCLMTTFSGLENK
jgi:hypothetical protein